MKVIARYFQTFMRSIIKNYTKNNNYDLWIEIINSEIIYSGGWLFIKKVGTQTP